MSRDSRPSRWRGVVRRVTAAKLHAMGCTREQLADPAERDRIYTELVEAFTIPETVDYQRGAEITCDEIWRLVTDWNPRG